MASLIVIAGIFNLEFLMLKNGGIDASHGQECLSSAKIKLSTSSRPNNATSISEGKIFFAGTFNLNFIHHPWWFKRGMCGWITKVKMAKHQKSFPQHQRLKIRGTSETCLKLEMTGNANHKSRCFWKKLHRWQQFDTSTLITYTIA